MFFAHDTLAEENERLRQELRRFRTENVELKNQVFQLKQAAERDHAYRDVLECQYDTLRKFISSKFGLPQVTGAVDGLCSSNEPIISYVQSLSRSQSLPSDPTSMVSDMASRLLVKCADAIESVKTNINIRSGERLTRLQEEWTKEPEGFTPLAFGLGSVPWARLLTDWAQGDVKKLDYLTQWLSYHLEGKRDLKSPFANPRVELKSLNSNMLAGFLELVVPTLKASRPDLNVQVYTKDFVGHSLRIVLEDKEDVSCQRFNHNIFNSLRGSCLAPIQEHVTIR